MQWLFHGHPRMCAPMLEWWEPPGYQIILSIFLLLLSQPIEIDTVAALRQKLCRSVEQLRRRKEQQMSLTGFDFPLFKKNFICQLNLLQVFLLRAAAWPARRLCELWNVRVWKQQPFLWQRLKKPVWLLSHPLTWPLESSPCSGEIFLQVHML